MLGTDFQPRLRLYLSLTYLNKHYVGLFNNTQHAMRCQEMGFQTSGLVCFPQFFPKSSWSVPVTKSRLRRTFNIHAVAAAINLSSLAGWSFS